MTRAGPPTKGRTVYLYKKQLLVAHLTDTPGEVFRSGADRDEPVKCGFASGQCLSAEWEEDLLKGLADVQSFDEMLRRMKYFKYRIENEPPKFKRRQFYRL